MKFTNFNRCFFFTGILRISSFLIFILLFSSLAHAADIQAQLDNVAGSGLSVQNSTNAEVARIDNVGNLTTHGNVGIGTTVPAGSGLLLYVSPGGGGALLPSYAGPGDAFIQNNLEVDGTTFMNDVYINGLEVSGLSIAGNQPLAMNTVSVAGNSYFALSAGNVGIGTSSALNKLTVKGSGVIGTGASYLTATAPANGLIVQGNVGIGSIAPGKALDVQGTVRATGLVMSGSSPTAGYVLTASDSAGDVTWSSAGSVGGWSVVGSNVYETGLGNVGIGTVTVNQGALVVTNGNVGIGTWAPSSMLSVGANGFMVNGNGAISATTGITSSGSYTQTGNGIDAFSGNVGIGSTAPGKALDVQGTVRAAGLVMSGSSPTAGYVLTASDSAGDVTWSSAGSVGGWTAINTTDLYQTSNGNVGIGTTKTTAAALTVMNGNVGIGTWVPASTLSVVGSMSVAVVSKSGNYLATAGDHVIFVNAIGGSVTVTLPAVASVAGREYIIKKTDSSAHSVNIQGNGADTIDGQNTVSTSVQYQAYTVISDGTQWLIV